jgi:glucose-1-phosphate thymidylyltransferase
MNKKYKGIVLAGGSGTRLYPITMGISKQQLPIYDKPMIYYPISVLMLAGIQDILIISTPDDINGYKKLLGSGNQFGVRFEYAIQEKPEGIAQAFIIGEEFIGNNNVSLVLGDNIFYGQNFSKNLEKATNFDDGATLFGYHVQNPSDFGVLEFDKKAIVKSIQEKPKSPKSNYAVTGLYFYDNAVLSIAKKIQPSKRRELEITDINNEYLKMGKLRVEILGRGFAWLDTGTHDSLLQASHFVQTVEHRQGLKIACLEEIGYKKGWLSKKDIIKQSSLLKKTSYEKYLLNIISEEI